MAVVVVVDAGDPAECPLAPPPLLPDESSSLFDVGDADAGVVTAIVVLADDSITLFSPIFLALSVLVSVSL